MKAGDLSTIFFLEEAPTPPSNPWTTAEGGWTEVCRVNASMRQASGNERIKAGMVDSTVASVLQLNSDVRITKQHRLREYLSQKTYNIVGINDKGKGEYELVVKESAD